MRFWKAGMLIGAVLATAGCDRQSSKQDVPAASPVVETPARKPGLWKQTMTAEGLDMIQSVTICLDKAADSKIAWWGQQGIRENCQKNDVTRNADGSWSFSSVCELGPGMKTVSNGRAVGKFDSNYQVVAETTTSGSPMPEMNGTRTVTIDAEWQGECPAGVVAGDMILPGGQKVNVLKMTEGPPG